jgi:fructose/tagatose bisphosphate aldolase
VLKTVDALGLGEKGRYLLAATFGNVHGVYKPGNVKLRPSILNDIQDAVGAKYGKDKPFDLVFHGGSGSLLEEIREALDYGVVKMNVDTDTQYAFTRRSPSTCSATTTACSRSTARSATRSLRPAVLRQGRRGRHGRPRGSCCKRPGALALRALNVCSTRRCTRNAGTRARRRPVGR